MVPAGPVQDRGQHLGDVSPRRGLEPHDSLRRCNRQLGLGRILHREGVGEWYPCDTAVCQATERKVSVLRITLFDRCQIAHNQEHELIGAQIFTGDSQHVIARHRADAVTILP